MRKDQLSFMYSLWLNFIHETRLLLNKEFDTFLGPKTGRPFGISHVGRSGLLNTIMVRAQDLETPWAFQAYFTPKPIYRASKAFSIEHTNKTKSNSVTICADLCFLTWFISRVKTKFRFLINNEFCLNKTSLYHVANCHLFKYYIFAMSVIISKWLVGERGMQTICALFVRI